MVERLTWRRLPPLFGSQDIRSLWPASHNPFYAGFGNRSSDVIAYRAAGVPPLRIFVINPQVARELQRRAPACRCDSEWLHIALPAFLLGRDSHCDA